jgi:hypothetical protein
MLNFLRKLRRKEMKFNAKYIKYAIGEIVLVVAGILIALQINLASERYKERLLEIEILEAIQEEILLDTTDLKHNLVNFHYNFLESETKLLSILHGFDDEFDTATDFSDALGGPVLVLFHQATFNHIQSIDIGIISNKQIKKDIGLFYDYYVNALIEMENNKPEYETYGAKRNFFAKYFEISKDSLVTIASGIKSEDYFSPDLTKPALSFKDAKGAKKDEAFKLVLSESIFLRKIKIDMYNETLRRMDDLDSAINRELEFLKR